MFRRARRVSSWSKNSMSTLLDCGLLSTTRVAQPVISFDQAKAIADVDGTPALVLSSSVLQRNYEAMRSEMPGVELFYAAKANPEFLVLKNLREFGSSVDVCSYREMQAAVNAGFTPDQMIHTHPCKTIANLVDCYTEGLRWFTFDAPSEIAKFVKYTPDVNLILRLAASSQSSLINLSAKFGCAPKEAGKLLRQAHRAGMNVKALSFHVGSQCLNPADFRAMLLQARKVWDEGVKIGCPLEVLDIGGGFPAPYRSGTTQYVIDDGLYGAFSGIVYDHAEFPLLVEDAENRPHRPCIIAGPTCDSGDIVCRDQPLPDLEVGELVLVPTMGAYSSASACGFNGLDIPRYVEVE